MRLSMTALPAGAASAPTRPRTGRLAAASLVGTTLEWYDFTVYNTLAALIFNRLFFPSVDPVAGAVLAFSTYAVGYLSRPLGGLVFGGLGDRHGRRAVLVATLVVMGVTSAAIGLLPAYDTLGVASPILLVALRFVQGMALGGEWAGAVLLAMEGGPPDRRGLFASFAQVGPSAGTLIATGALALSTASLSDAAFLAWGWRLPLLGSLLLVGVGLWIRRGVAEAPAVEAPGETRRTAEAPVGAVMRGHWRSLLIAGGARVGADVHYGLTVVFTLTYVTGVLHLPRTLALAGLLVGAGANACCIPLAGALSDRFGRRPIYAAGVAGAAAWAFGLFALLDTSRPGLVVLAIVVGLVLHAIMYGPQAAFVAERFPTAVRATGASLAYTFAGIVGGGFAPLIIAALYERFRTTTPISLYELAALAVTAVSLALARETAGRPLPD